MQSILVVDDNEEIRNLLKEALGKEGYHVFEGADGRESIELLEALSPDMMLVDIFMPNMNGLELLVEIRKRGFATPVIVISGAGDALMAQKTLDAGANAFMSKPLKMKELVQAVTTHLDVKTAAAGS